MRRHARTRSRRGGVLVEFALVSLVLYLLLAATFEMGRAVFSAQVAQTAADVGARELAKVPLRPAATFDKLFNVPLDDLTADERADAERARERVYDRKFLVLPLDDADTPPLPVLNQQLKLRMIVDTLPDGVRVRRYPGAIVPLAENAFGYTVVVPVLTADGTDYEVAEVVEEVRPRPDVEGPFSLVAPEPNPPEQRGLVALRVNYPYQAAALSGFRPNPENVPGEPPRPNLDFPVEVPEDDRGPAGTYAGRLGLGRQYALGREVRPYRKVISAQAVARREVFQ